MSPSAFVAPFVLLLGVAGTIEAQCPDGTPPPCRGQAVHPPAANSVAVLYFENLSRDTGDAYIADGLTEEVTARLGQITRLVVTPRAAVRIVRAAATTMSLAQLGRTLNASYLVSGSTRSANGRVRVTVELVRAATGARVWGNQYDRQNADLLALQEDIARAVATGIAGRLLPAEQRSLMSRGTRNAQAYDHYLRGNRLLWKETAMSVLGAISEYEAALALDGGFTAARGRLAYCYGLALNWGYQPGGLSVDSVLARGAASAERAIQEDSSVSDAWLGRGLVLFFRGAPADVAQAPDALQRAVELDSTNDAAHTWYAVVLRRLGRFDQAEQEYRRALALNPGRVQAAGDIGFIALSRRQYALAVQWYDRSVALDSTVASAYTLRARARAGAGDLRGALADAVSGLRLSIDVERPRALAVMAEMQARAGDTSGAVASFQQALREFGWSAGNLPASIGIRNVFDAALAALALGQRDLALEILEHARPRGPWLWSYLVWQDFDPLRAEPRFQRVFSEARPAGAPDRP